MTFKLRTTILLSILAFGSLPLMAQVLITDAVRLQDRSTGKSILLQEPSGLTSNVSFNFPATAGILGQSLSVSSQSGTTNNLRWQPTAKAFGGLANRLTGNVTTAALGTPATKLSVNIDAGRVYRVQGILYVERVTPGTTPEDGFTFTLKLVTTGTTERIELVVRCYGCPANTTNSPSSTIVTSSNTAAVTVNPGGTGTTNAYGPYAFQIEAFVTTGSETGSLELWASDIGTANTYSTTMYKDSFVVLTELN